MPSIEEVRVTCKRVRSELSISREGRDKRIVGLAEELALAIDETNREDFWLVFSFNYRNEYYKGAEAALAWLKENT